MNTHTTTRFAIGIFILFLFILPRSYAQGTAVAASAGNVAARISAPDSIVSKFDAGTVLTVLQVDEEWIKVALPGKKSGWVRRDVLKLPDPDAAVINRDWPLFGRRGNAYSPADTSGPKVGRVRKGMTAKKLLLHGAWYELEFPGGLTGWVPMHVVEPSLAEVTRVSHDWIAVADTSRTRAGSKNDVQIEEGKKLIQLARGIGWVRVRTSDGREGWLESTKLVVEGGLPLDATSVFWYRTFDAIDKAGDRHFILSVLVFLFHWILLPIVPGLLVFYLYYYSIGRVKIVNNWFLKIGYGILAFGIGVYVIMYFLPGIPPFMGGFTGNIMQIWSFLILIGVIIGIRRRMSYDRCDHCRKLGAGRINGIDGGATSTNVETTKTTYGYADGHTRTETKETTSTSRSHLVHVVCRFCGYRWAINETSTSRRTTVK